ncbi:MAG: CDP-glycerol glycerophosphotransferase family protein [Peptostreptococcaceae bacterium]
MENKKINIYLSEYKELCEYLKYEYTILDKDNYELKEGYNVLITDNNLEIKNINLFDKVYLYDDIYNDLESLSSKIYYKDYDYHFLKNELKYAENDSFENLITGNSYPLKGIDKNFLSNKSYNLSMNSQDLYYSYKLTKELLKHNKSIKNCIIGTGYFITYYDLSRGKNDYSKNMIRNIYGPLLNDYHNSEKIESSNNYRLYDFIEDKFMENIFYLDNILNYFINKMYISHGKSYINDFRNRDVCQLGLRSLRDLSINEKLSGGFNRSSIHNNLKKFTHTNEENSNILNKFLQLLTENNINIYIVVFPTSDYYRSNLDEEFKRSFYRNIEKLESNYKFNLIDMNDNSYNFNDEDYKDFYHLGEKGCIKATKIINESIYGEKMINLLKEIKLNLGEDVNKAYEIISNNQELLKSNSMYWALRGDLCFVIEDYETAIMNYEESINIDCLNTYSVESLINCYDKLENIEEKNIYTELLSEINNNFTVEGINNILVNRLKVSEVNIEEIINSNKYIYYKDDKLIRNGQIILLDEYLLDCNNDAILVIQTKNYVSDVKYLARKGINRCIVIANDSDIVKYVHIDTLILGYIREGNDSKTITMNIFNNADSNVSALSRFVPDEYVSKYNINIINGRDVYSIDQNIIVPLISKMTVSGHRTFLDYPEANNMYNLDLGHGIMPIKACGNMEKIYKGFSYNKASIQNLDKLCVVSNMDMLLRAAFLHLSEDKFLISGSPRSDYLINANGRKNIEKIFNRSFEDKKIIFNMPTFHIHENSGVKNGDGDLTNFIKVEDFDYESFDKFLEINNMICIMKAHHAEERTLKAQQFNSKNILFIFNSDLENMNFDLYELLNGADLLITDYSTIYSDFIFMNKPCIFTNGDIEEYRNNRGIALEPYDFWTAGYKVQTQKKLEQALLDTFEKDEYRQKREQLREVFYKNIDNKNSKRVWDFIDSIFTYN